MNSMSAIETKARLSAGLAACDAPTTATWSAHPDAALRAKGWEQITIDGVSIPAIARGGAVWLWQPDEHLFRCNGAQEFALRKSQKKIVAGQIRNAVVNHVAIVEAAHAHAVEAWERQQAKAAEQKREFDAAMAKADVKRTAFKAVVEGPDWYLSGAAAHLFVSDPYQDIGGGVRGSGGYATLSFELHPSSPEEARSMLDALVAAGFAQRIRRGGPGSTARAQEEHARDERAACVAAIVARAQDQR